MDISNINQIPLRTLKNAHQQSTIGQLLLAMGKITPDEIDRVLQMQKSQDKLFGDIARKLGFVTEADVRQALALQFGFPYLQASQGGFSKELVAAYQPFSPQVEALRALRSMLTLRWFNEDNKALAVVAANSGEGCSHLAANLAVVFSQLGARTLLIDADLRKPRQKAIFNLSEARGLSDILIGRADMSIATKIDSLIDLSVLGAGTVPPNPQELLSRKSFSDLIKQSKSFYDVVIVDTAPAGVTSDAQAVAASCGGALLVSRLDKTPLADLTNVRDQLIVSNVQIVTAVVNDL